MKQFSTAWYILISITLLVTSSSVSGQYNEKYRPQYHFSPNREWIGDPDGLVKYKGIYHLFWWGHAYSSDLVHWTQLPYPIQGDPRPYQVTTGSAVINNKGNNALPKNSMVAFLTLARDNDQRVGIAISTDSNTHFTELNLSGSNPILTPSPVSRDFRDPQVFWDTDRNRWAMVMARGDMSKIDFFHSTNLTS